MGSTNCVKDDANISNTDESSQSAASAPQSTQGSFPSAAGQAVGVGTDCIVVGGIAEESYADNGDQFENGEKHSSPTNEPGTGGVNGDSASVEVSAMTTARSVHSLSSPAAMNKLHFSSLGLHGRKQETEVLNKCYDRFVAKSAPGESGGELEIDIKNISKSNEVVFISGESGTGKTALAESIKDLVASSDGTFTSGKFDLKLRGPYFGIISLFRELCGEMLDLRRTNNSKYQELCQNILSDVGAEIGLLTNIVPVLEEVIEIPTVAGAVYEQGNKEAKERLKYAFLQFFRVITRYFDHLVVVLDDLQWADVPSIELLREIIDDRDIHIMLIGIYRSNEVDGSHFLAKTIQDMHCSKKDRWDLTEVSIGNLDVAACEDIMVQLLSAEASAETSRLADICHKRTAGNAFHLLAYLAMLQEQKLLKLNTQLNQWTWDMDQIERDTALSSNVVELIKATISKQPQMLKQLLQLASCLGTSFEKDIVVAAYPQMHDDIGHVEAGRVITELFSLAVREAFMERQGDSRYRWVHDAIQSEAMQQISEAEAVAYKFKLGKVLLQNLDEKDVENNLFVIVDLLSVSKAYPEEDKTILLDLYLKAAKKAVEFSSFESCVRYAGNGISLLPQDKWRNERDTSLELYSLIVEAHLSLANMDEMKVYSDEVLQQSTLTELEKVRVHICNISLVGNTMNKAGEALDMSFAVLKKLGCKFPTNTLLQMRLAIASVATAKLPTENDVAALPLMEDPIKRACMEIMVNAAIFSHHSNNIFAFIMINSRMVQWTMKYGCDVYSAPAFALFGMIKKMTSYKTGALYADRGFQLLDMCREGKRTESKVTYISWFQIYPFSKPIHSTLNHLLRGYKAGMEMGDVESAMWNLSQYICNSIVAGKALKPLALDCVTYIEQMQMFKQDFTHHMSLPFAQGVLNMIGDADDPLELSGSAMVEKDFLEMIESSEGREWSFLHLQIFKSMMCSFFGDFEQGAKLALERGDVYEKKNGSPLAMTDTLHQGISLYAMARKTKEKRYIKAAKKVKKKVAAWVKKGNVNAVHYVLLLEAEDAALEGKSDDATKIYPKAIVSAARSEFLQDAALATERFAEYLLHDLKDNVKAGQQFQESIKYYTGWGSDYKADLLKLKFSYLWEEEVPNDVAVAPETINDPKCQGTQDSSGTSGAANTPDTLLSSTRDALVTAFADNGGNSKEVLRPLATVPKKSQKMDNKTLGLEGDEEAGRGGVGEDSASIDISALTIPYVKPLAQKSTNLISHHENGDEIIGDKSDADVFDDETQNPSSLIGKGQLQEAPNELVLSRGRLLEEYKAELNAGDVEGAASNIALRCYENWSGYHSLADLEKEIEASIIALDQIGEGSYKVNLQAYLLVVRRLRNVTSKDETNLGFEELLKVASDTDSNANVFHTVKMMQLELLVQFHDWDGALICLTEAPNMRSSFLQTHASARATFLEALVYLKSSSSATSWLGKRKRKRQALKLLKTMNGWLKNGDDNVRHLMHILMAESYVLEGSERSAEDNFKAAISIAELGGFSHDEALAQELAGAWYKGQGKDSMSTEYFETSQKLNTEWGATSKVETEYIYYN